MGRHPDLWPEAARSLHAELAAHPGRLALICGPGDQELLPKVAGALGSEPTYVGKSLTAGSEPPSPEGVLALLGQMELLADCEILFDPELRVDPLQLLRVLARRAPRIAIWPGRIQAGRAIYSEPGRRDHYDRPLSDAVVLRPRPTRFPDDMPYTTERIP